MWSESILFSSNWREEIDLVFTIFEHSQFEVYKHKCLIGIKIINPLINT